MTASDKNLLVCLCGPTAVVKISGRANFSCSVPFKTLLNELRHRGMCKFLLDLRDCVTMDSTFLGVLAGQALRLAECRDHQEASLNLFQPNPRILDLLENLGISHLFEVCKDPPVPIPETAQMEATAPAGEAASKEEISRTCLEAHQTLMEVNPDNIPKFKEVTQFLAEDLKKMQ